MARTIAEIQADIIDQIQSDPTLNGLTSPSATALWRLFTYVVASAIWVLEKLFDAHVAEVLERVAKLKPHSLRWYQGKALDFQYGSDLPEGEDSYDNSNLTPDQVAAQMIVAQAAVVEENGTLVVKITKEVSGELEPLSTAEVDSFTAYIEEVKDAGVAISVRSFNPDKLKIEADIYYDPLVLNEQGQRLDGTDNEPIQNAIKDFLRELPFNGAFVKAKLVDKLQDVSGVYVPEIRLCQAAKFDTTIFTTVDIEYNPFSGFLRIYDDVVDLDLTFISQEDV